MIHDTLMLRSGVAFTICGVVLCVIVSALTAQSFDDREQSNNNGIRVELKILNLRSVENCAVIDSMVVLIPGVISSATVYDAGTCTLQLDNLNRIHRVFADLQEAGYKVDRSITMSGPGLTCDIVPQASVSDTVPLRVLADSPQSVRAEFNRLRDNIRILTIPNPACLACVKGQRFINSLFERHFSNTRHLSGFTVWTSINGWGNRSDAEALLGELRDARMMHFWDGDMLVGKLFKTPLQLEPSYPTAWDVYLVYRPGVIWDEKIPPAPDFWMHQIGGENTGANPEFWMDEREFLNKLRGMVQPDQFK